MNYKYKNEFFINIILFIIFCIVVFHKNIEWLTSSSLDGQYFLTNIKLQLENTDLNLNSSWNLFQGLGTVYFPFNAKWFPEYWVAFFLGKEFPKIEIILFTGSATILFCATYFFSRAVNVDKFTGLLSSWLLVLTSYPIYGASILYPIISLNPAISTGMAVSLVMLASIYNLNLNKNPLISCLILLGSYVWLLGSLTSLVIIFFPALITYLILAISIGPFNKKHRLIESIYVLIFLLIITLRFGPLDFLMGHILDSPASIFPEGFSQGLRSENSSVIIGQANLINKLIGFIIVFSILFSFFQNNTNIKRLAISTLIILSILVIANYLIEYENIIISIHLAYFEFVMWPIYAVLVGFLIHKIINFTLKFNDSEILKINIFLLFIPIIFLLLIINFPKKLDGIKFPPIENEIVKFFLIKKQSKEFSGRVLNISGKVISKDDLTWSSQSTVLHSNVKNTGNDNKLIGFWFYGIPTVEEYSSIYSPLLFYIERIASESHGLPMRNIFVFGDRSKNMNLYNLLGVSVLIKDGDGDDDTLNNKKNNEIDYIENKYINGWFATNVSVSNDLRDILNNVVNNNISDKVFLSKFKQKELNKLKENKIFMDGDKLRVIASSEGHSLFIIPFLFSNCIVSKSNIPNNITIHRVNGFLLGFEFYKNLDSTIQYSNGMFANSDCKIKDYIYNSQLSESRILSLNRWIQPRSATLNN